MLGRAAWSVDAALLPVPLDVGGHVAAQLSTGECGAFDVVESRDSNASNRRAQVVLPHGYRGLDSR